jgi:hypothetical protein
MLDISTRDRYKNVRLAIGDQNKFLLDQMKMFKNGMANDSGWQKWIGNNRPNFFWDKFWPTGPCNIEND